MNGFCWAVLMEKYSGKKNRKNADFEQTVKQLPVSEFSGIRQLLFANTGLCKACQTVSVFHTNSSFLSAFKR